MPAALRIRLRPPSHPTRYCARSDAAVGQLDVDAGVVLRETRHLTSAIDRHRQLVDPAGQDALDVVLPQPEPVGVPGGKVADVQTDPGEPRDLRHLPLARGTDRRFRADREPRWCVSADRPRASRRGPGWRAARQWRRRRPPTPTRPPTSALSDLLRRSPPHARSLFGSSLPYAACSLFTLERRRARLRNLRIGTRMPILELKYLVAIYHLGAGARSGLSWLDLCRVSSFFEKPTHDRGCDHAAAHSIGAA